MSDTTPTIGGPDTSEDLEQLLDELIATVEHAKSMPLSSSAIIGRDEVLSLLESARSALPFELQRARRVLQDHEALRLAAEREALEVIDEARAQAAHLVQRTEIVRQARHEAERLVVDAEAESRRIRHEAEDYVDRKLAAFEIVLDRTIRTVQSGRERLTATMPNEVEPTIPEVDDGTDAGLFDQDTR
jgi:cell division septum initiation protein DivIVA